MRLAHLLVTTLPLTAAALSLPNVQANSKRGYVLDNTFIITESGVPAVADENCTYPLPAFDFNISNFAGPSEYDMSKWYLWASTDGPLPKECQCNVGYYGRYENGNSSLALKQTCSFGGVTSTVTGWADRLFMFGEGSYTIHVGPYHINTCQGPNMIVQKYYFNKPCDPKRTEGADDEPYETVIITTDDFNGWFVYSRTQVVEHSIIDEYVKDALALKPKPNPWTYSDQSNCTWT